MKLLAAVDLSRISSYVIEAVHRVAMATDAQVHVFYVASSLSSELTPDLSPVPNWKRGEERPAEELALGDLVQQLIEAGVEATALVRQGRPASIALEEAERIDADLIVVGSHGLPHELAPRRAEDYPREECPLSFDIPRAVMSGRRSSHHTAIRACHRLRVI